MLSPQMARTKAVIKKTVPIAAVAYRGFRQIAGFRASRSRRNLNRYIRDQTGSIVASGPFAGMRVLEGASWGDGDIAPKLLGTYEQELHETIGRFRGRTYDAIVDIGCAEGYYAIGLARLFPTLTVHAFDTDQAALRVAHRAAEANGVAHRLMFGPFCDRDALDALAARHGSLLVISDCEGYESDLFGSGDRGPLRRSDLIIECHDELRPNSTDAMTDTLAATHTVSRIGATGRNPNQFPFLTDLHEVDRWTAVCENRPYCSHWLACESHAASDR